MKKLGFYSLSLLCVLSLVSCRKDTSELDDKPILTLPPSDYKMTWSDEFDGKTLDLNKWSYRSLGLRRQAYNVREAVYVDTLSGNLIIRSFMRNDSALTGMIGTQGKFEQQYGYFECRARVNSISSGHWVAFWLQSPDMGKTLDPRVDGMEIDIMEYVRGDPNHVNHALHWNGYGANQQSKSWETRSENRMDDGQYHVYSLEWTPEFYRFFIDNRLVWEVLEPISQRKQYVILSGEISDKNLFKSTFGSQPVDFEVDYVRVFEKSK